MPQIITDIGRSKLLAATPMNPVTIKTAALGTGTGPFDGTILNLITPNWSGNASAPKREDYGLSVTTYVPASVGGVDYTEWGLFDVTGDLIAYGQWDVPVYKPVGLMTWQPVFIMTLTSGEVDLVVTDTLNWDHNYLNNRGVANAHPISSITGLQAALDNQKIHNNLTDRDSVDAHPISSITGLQDDLNQAVRIIGDQSINGVKTFNQTVKLSHIVSNDDDSVIGADANGLAVLHKSTGFTINGNDEEIIFAGELIGDGARLTNLDATNLSIGTVNSARLPQATESAVGAAEIATTTEVITGTDNQRIVTPLQFKNASSGWGQSVSNVTSSRVAGTTYTNTTGSPIFISVMLAAAGINRNITLTVGGEVVGIGNNTEQHDKSVTLTFLIPHNVSYKVDGTFTGWKELR